jgi:peptide/nickel transport system permease protein
MYGSLANAREAQAPGILLLFRRFPVLPLAILLIVLVLAVAGEGLAPYDPNALDLGLAFSPPFWVTGAAAGHWLGTDNLGRDILSRIVVGARVSVIVAAYAIAFSGALGAAIGMAAGYFAGGLGAVLMRLADIQLAIPSVALALLLAAALQPGLSTVIAVIVLSYWSWYARIIRGEILSLKERDYVAFAQIAGVSTFTIFRRHLLPNILNTLLVLATLQVGQVILFEAGLSFLGLGVRQPDVSWGLMLSDAREYITTAWWPITMPGVAIVLVCLAANLTGDWVRDRLDPRLRQL